MFFTILKYPKDNWENRKEYINQGNISSSHLYLMGMGVITLNTLLKMFFDLESKFAYDTY